MADLKFIHNLIFLGVRGMEGLKGVKVVGLIKCSMSSNAVMAGSDITATRQLKGNKK